MGTTVHRRDITHADFSLLARFCHALTVLDGFAGTSVYWELGKVPMTLPIWFLAGSGWTLAGYKVFTREAIWLETSVFRRICRYLQVKEPQLVDLLFRLSMLSVVSGQQLHEPRRIRQPFTGKLADDAGRKSSVPDGFVIERRRATGGFRQRVRGGADAE